MSIWRTMLGLPVKSEKKAITRRNYHAASTSRLFADFMSSSRSADSELKPSLELMRNRSRELARNDVYVRRYLNRLSDLLFVLGRALNRAGGRGDVLWVQRKNA